MAYINTETMQYPLTEAEIRAENPGIPFGSYFNLPDKYRNVYPFPQPEYNAVISNIREGTPIPGMGGYYEKWEIVPKFTEYEENGVSVTVAEQEAQALAADALQQAEEQDRQDRIVAKLNRQASVDSIVVTTTAGNIFDGDEVSQNRMARAIIALQSTNTPTTLWVLADNSVIQTSATELSEALALAGVAQASMWVIE